MSNAAEQSTGSEALLNGKNVIIAGAIWGLLSLALFLSGLFVPEIEESFGYLISTYIAEYIPFIGAALLCYRNWGSPKIASGRDVWLFLGLGILSYFIADLIFGFWEIYWGLDPEISPADLFYMAFYIFLGWGMILAVLSRRLNLEVKQWVTLGTIALAGTALAFWIALAQPAESETLPEATPVEISESVTFNDSIALAPPVVEAEAEEENPHLVPAWVMSLQDFLLQFSTPVNFFYIICDVALLIIAVMLLLAFWGGTFSWSWRAIAAAALAKYLADMWFKYAATLPSGYESGGLLEVFFVFSGILFAIGASQEYDISSRPRKSRRKRGSSEA